MSHRTSPLTTLCCTSPSPFNCPASGPPEGTLAAAAPSAFGEPHSPPKASGSCLCRVGSPQAFELLNGPAILLLVCTTLLTSVRAYPPGSTRGNRTGGCPWGAQSASMFPVAENCWPQPMPWALLYSVVTLEVTLV